MVGTASPGADRAGTKATLLSYSEYCPQKPTMLVIGEQKDVGK